MLCVGRGADEDGEAEEPAVGDFDAVAKEVGCGLFAVEAPGDERGVAE